jgi:16S rRNA (adenine1518-N6/adenine1519-N6)-dimethyltransferase
MQKNNSSKFQKNHKAKKSLGQNFLKSALALNKIIEAGEIKKGEIVLEIGPGKGALTSKLLEAGATVLAIEKDRNLFDLLTEKFEKEIKEGNLILKNEDILELPVSQNVFSKSLGRSDGDGQRKFEASNFRAFNEDILRGRYKIIANIPYNITGAILKKFLTEEKQPEMMVLMVQHEVAKRVIANNGKESILSVSVKAYGEPKMIMKVPARYFSPAPKVDSAVIKINNISRKMFKGGGVASALVNEEKFWGIVKAGFAHKRKVLIKNLEDIYPRQDLVQAFEKLKISEKTRAEDLSLDVWTILAQTI